MKRMNKKKTLTILIPVLFIAAMLCFYLAGTAAASFRKGDDTSGEPAASMEETVRTLFDAHLDCMLHVMELSELPYEQPSEMPQDGLVPVTDARFPTYAAFEDYLRGIYSEQLADFYLHDFPYEGDTKYVNVDGALYLNLWLCGGKGYYVDWSDYAVTILSESETACDFTVTASETLPAENPAPQEYTVTGRLVKESAGWRMDTRVY